MNSPNVDRQNVLTLRDRYLSFRGEKKKIEASISFFLPLFHCRTKINPSMHPGVIVIFFSFLFFSFFFIVRPRDVTMWNRTLFHFFFFYQSSRFGGKYLDFIFEAIFRDTGQISFIIKKCFKSFCSISGSTLVVRGFEKLTKVYTIDSFLSLFFFDAYQLTLLNHRMVEADFFFWLEFSPSPSPVILFLFFSPS